MQKRDQTGMVAWSPDEKVRARAQLTKFLTLHGIESFQALYQRSVQDVEWFTGRLLDFLQVRFDKPYSSILDLSAGLQWPRWCVGASLNIARTCLDRHLQTHVADTAAIVWEGEEGARKELSYSELAADVERCAGGLRGIGLGVGDAIGIHLPMSPEAVIALLATARIGAIAVPLFSGYGHTAIEVRLCDVGAKALITCDGFLRRGRVIAGKGPADEALRHCPTVSRVVVVRRTGVHVPMQAGRDMDWDALLEQGDRAGKRARDIEPMQAEDPLLILYSSGTTGRPKGILHTHCGFPIKAAQDMAFGTDVGAGDRIAWITDLGWMMGPWLIYGATILGATMMLYDGAPDYPAPHRLWRYCADHRVEILGVSPSLVRSLMAQGLELPRQYDLSALRILASTGECWEPSPWWWLFDTVGAGCLPIINYSGGTEISGGILMGNPLLPLKPCSFPAPCPGIAADVLDEQGRSVRDSVGELVICKPWIGMARGFWQDRERYVETYWSRWPNTWVHGDWARHDSDGYWYLFGRSDDTLKIAGKRVGPAEIESKLVSHPSISEAAVIGVPHDIKGTAMIAFCVPVLQEQPDVDLAEKLRQQVAGDLGKAFRPEQVIFVPELPRTGNGKIMRRIVRAAFLGEDLGDISALANPQAVEGIRRISAKGRDSREGG